jgi:hypothetical protein
MMGGSILGLFVWKLNSFVFVVRDAKVASEFRACQIFYQIRL